MSDASVLDAEDARRARAYFREALTRWDTTARQGMPQIARGMAVYTWRGPGEDFPRLYCESASTLGAACAPGRTPTPPDPGTALPAPAGRVVRGFALDPTGRRVAALLGTPDSELAEVWILAADTEPGRLDVPPVWHARPVWIDAGPHHESSLWILTGKPPVHEVWRVAGSSEDARPVGLPAELAHTPEGLRLRLEGGSGGVRLIARHPGTEPTTWIFRDDGWVPEPGSAAAPVPVPATVPAAGRVALATSLGEVTAREVEDAVVLSLGGTPVHALSAAERLLALSVSEDQTGVSLWVHSASPERPSGVVCVDLTRASASASASAAGRGDEHNTHLHLTILARDGTPVPLVVSLRREFLEGDHPRAPRPLLLSVYGGFGVHHRTEAEPTVAAWLEAGGVFVAAQVRGGGELGPEWHEAGRGTRKIRAVHDLIDVAHALVAGGWTRTEDMTALGASHGGFVVTAAALIDPSAFGRVIAVAPVLDIVDLRRHGLGTQWLHEFGVDGETTAAQRAEYSPLHLATARERAESVPPILCCILGRDERVDNTAATRFADELNSRGGRVALLTEAGDGHAQRAAGTLLDFSATLLGFAAGTTPWMGMAAT
ncbi:prolyl oligopeptidase family serine peptidase [Mycetocola sp. JXN-3]|uniref:prolyl oligopeptidase family serine peptidase n=1 Tax=Mycetocola sp. JXN-3 TaxID=2116510 RepID=UPI00165CF5F1|nr:prolyl oligopeptidase family serine peptidase [Mycetocola sp. JXN-3]